MPILSIYEQRTRAIDYIIIIIIIIILILILIPNLFYESRAFSSSLLLRDISQLCEFR